MPAVCHLLNLPYVQEMKSYSVPSNKALAREGSCPSQTRKVALQVSEYAKQEQAALDRRALVFFCFLLFPNASLQRLEKREGKGSLQSRSHWILLILLNPERPSVECSGTFKDWDGGSAHFRGYPWPWLGHSALPGLCFIREGAFQGHRQPAREVWASSSLQELAASSASHHALWSSHHPRPGLLDLVQRHSKTCSSQTLQHLFSASPKGQTVRLTQNPSHCNHSKTTLRVLPDPPTHYLPLANSFL